MNANDEKPLPAPGHHGPDEVLLEMGLRLTPAERLRWLEETVEELQPWVGLAAKVPSPDPSAGK